MKPSGPEPPPCIQVIATMELKHSTHGCYLFSLKKVTFQNFLCCGSNWMSILQYYFLRSSYLKNIVGTWLACSTFQQSSGIMSSLWNHSHIVWFRETQKLQRTGRNHHRITELLMLTENLGRFFFSMIQISGKKQKANTLKVMWQKIKFFSAVD